MQNQIIKLSGLTCSACKKVTEKRISSISGVISADVSLENNEVTIQSENGISLLQINDALKETPYKVLEK